MEFFTDDVNQCEGCTEIDSKFDRHGKEDTLMPVVLSEEDEHGLIEDMHIAERRLLRGLALEVNNV